MQACRLHTSISGHHTGTLCAGKLKAEQSASAQLLQQAFAKARAYRAKCLKADAAKQQQQEELASLIATVQASPAAPVTSDHLASDSHLDNPCAADAALELQDNLPAAADESLLDGNTSAMAGAVPELQMSVGAAVVEPTKVASDSHTDRQRAPQASSVLDVVTPSEVATPAEPAAHIHTAPAAVVASVPQSSVPAAAAASPVMTMCASESHAAGAASALQTVASIAADNLLMHSQIVDVRSAAPEASRMEVMDQLAIPAPTSPTPDAVQDCVSGKTLPALNKEVAGSTLQQVVRDTQQAGSPRIAAHHVHEETKGVTVVSGVARHLQDASTQTEGVVEPAGCATQTPNQPLVSHLPICIIFFCL